jgi:hypothetical protein
MLTIPNTAGLGLKLDVDALAKYATPALNTELRALLQSEQ